MIITRLNGGLGNQMFQYAIGKSLSLKHKSNLYLDVFVYKSYLSDRTYELSKAFQGDFRTVVKEDIKELFGPLYINGLDKLTSRQPFLRFSKKYIKEPSFNFWPGVKDVPADCYLSGYWQSEEYFKGISDQIRKDFIFKPFDSKQNLRMEEKIKCSENSISIHVRRADYISNSKAFLTHGLCPISYYKLAINYFLKTKRNVNFFVFSDDIEWAMSNITIRGAENSFTYISHNKGVDSFNDMALMSLCSFNIIANSTFSWWAAWLNKNKSKKVLCPSKWFADGRETTSLIPRSWVSI